MSSRLIVALAAFSMVTSGPLVCAQAPAAGASVALAAPTKQGGLPVMDAFAARASAREWASRPLAPQDLSDLLWAANGVNRPDGRRTAASATNAQDVDVFVLDASGAYVYDASGHALRRVADGDRRAEIAGPQAAAPVQLVLVSDLSRFRAGSPEQRAEWGALDSGIVAQNVMLFCAGRGLATRPRASFDRQALARVLQLKESQRAFLSLPVGHRP
jgi:nitroreductase